MYVLLLHGYMPPPPPLLVVLDLNGTILDSTHRARRGVAVDARARAKFVYFRPGMHEFLAWLAEQHAAGLVEIAVWTSNSRDNARAVIETAFTEDQCDRLSFVMCRDDCLTFRDYSSKKPLRKILQRGYAVDRLLIIDDSPEKILHDSILTSSVDCYYQIPTFEASAADDATDNELQKLREEITRRLSE